MSELSYLVKYADDCEREKATRSVYLEYFGACMSTGNKPIGYTEYINQIEGTTQPQSNIRNSEDILRDMQNIEELYRKSKEELNG